MRRQRAARRQHQFDGAQDQDLRVWWIPQVPLQRGVEPFYVAVETVDAAKLLLRTLAEYDLYQLDTRIKPDYSNAGGLERYEASEREWQEFETADGDDIESLMREDAAKEEAA